VSIYGILNIYAKPSAKPPASTAHPPVRHDDTDRIDRIDVFRRSSAAGMPCVVSNTVYVYVVQRIYSGCVPVEFNVRHTCRKRERGMETLSRKSLSRNRSPSSSSSAPAERCRFCAPSSCAPRSRRRRRTPEQLQCVLYYYLETDRSYCR